MTAVLGVVAALEMERDPVCRCHETNVRGLTVVG